MLLNPSVTLALCPLRSGALTDWMMPPYVRIETLILCLLDSVYFSTAVPSANRPKLDFLMLSPLLRAKADGAMSRLAASRRSPALKTAVGMRTDGMKPPGGEWNRFR